MSETEQRARLEMLIGHLSDVLAPAQELVVALRLQANASVTTRGKLEHLLDVAGHISDQLRAIREEIAPLKVSDEDMDAAIAALMKASAVVDRGGSTLQ